MDAVETSIVPAQMPLSEELQEYYDYINTSNGNYVRGKYIYKEKDGSYQYQYDQNSGEIDNAIVYDEVKGYTINGEEWSDYKWGHITAEKTLKYSITTDSVAETINQETGISYISDGGMSDGRYYYGYGYMKNAYYTAIGNSRIENADEKIGTFSNCTTSVPTGTAGIDYVTITHREFGTDEYGNPIVVNQTTYYYTISKIEDRNPDNQEIENKFDQASSPFGTITDPSELPDEVYVKLYPDSFENPYKTSFSGNPQDNHIYLLNADQEAEGVEHEVTYYYYEGGYITQKYGEKEELVAYKKVYDSSNTSSGTEPVIMLYDKDGEPKEHTETYKNESGEDVEYVTVWYSYKYIYENYDDVKDLYVQDITGLDEGTDTDIYKVSNQYIIENGCLYQMISDKQISEDGKLSSISVTVPNSSDEDFNKNKYLMNETIQFYTRYKYNNMLDYFGASLFYGGMWKYTDENGNEEYYYLYKEDSNTPNPGITTYLVESCRVILGGASISGASVGGINLA